MRAGCFIAPLTFQLYWHSFNIGSPTSEYKAPFANIYRGMAVIGTQVCCMSVLWARRLFSLGPVSSHALECAVQWTPVCA